MKKNIKPLKLILCITFILSSCGMNAEEANERNKKYIKMTVLPGAMQLRSEGTGINEWGVYNLHGMHKVTTLNAIFAIDRGDNKKPVFIKIINGDGDGSDETKGYFNYFITKGNQPFKKINAYNDIPQNMRYFTNCLSFEPDFHYVDCQKDKFDLMFVNPWRAIGRYLTFVTRILVVPPSAGDTYYIDLEKIKKTKETFDRSDKWKEKNGELLKTQNSFKNSKNRVLKAADEGRVVVTAGTVVYKSPEGSNRNRIALTAWRFELNPNDPSKGTIHYYCSEPNDASQESKKYPFSMVSTEKIQTLDLSNIPGEGDNYLGFSLCEGDNIFTQPGIVTFFNGLPPVIINNAWKNNRYHRISKYHIYVQTRTDKKTSQKKPYFLLSLETSGQSSTTKEVNSRKIRKIEAEN